MSKTEMSEEEIADIVEQIGADTAPFIEELTRESMLRIKDSIKAAIITLPPYKIEANAASPIYLLETDVLAKIESVYESILQTLTIARQEAFSTEVATYVGETIDELHEIVEDAQALPPLPASPANNNGNNGFHVEGKTSALNALNGGVYRSKKQKKSRKHPK